MSPKEEMHLGLLIFAGFWDVGGVVPTTLVVTSTHEERSRWAASFAASSLVVAYSFWRLL